ncbi:FxLYD domain-containing protein [Amycolatopsis sp. NPDC051758]|uniref:FxLYD domain-containing protein n=1 Tax=Amycolatopsis sp. NPDC051758 TaxID=3363935 RepID=UPI0037BB9802
MTWSGVPGKDPAGPAGVDTRHTESRPAGRVRQACVRHRRARPNAVVEAGWRSQIGTATGSVRDLDPGKVKTFSLTTTDDVSHHDDYRVRIETVR